MSKSGKPRIDGDGDTPSSESYEFFTGKSALHVTATGRAPHLQDDGAALNGNMELEGSTSGATSEEDYDDLPSTPASSVMRDALGAAVSETGEDLLRRRRDRLPLLDTGTATKPPRAFVLATADSAAIRDAVRLGLPQQQRHKAGSGAPGTARMRRLGREKFSDLVFTRKFSAFDRQNQDAANSPFHGFYTLFWMAVFFFVVKIGAENWRKHGSPLGTNEIMKNMFRRDVLVLLVADGVMCAATGVSWLLQRAVRARYIDWDRTGWLLQNVCLCSPVGAAMPETKQP